MEYYNKNKFAYLPKKPVKSFQDLDVYQQALEANVFVVNFIVPVPTLSRSLTNGPQGDKKQSRKGTVSKEMAMSALERDNIGIGTADDIKKIILDTMTNCACSIPHLIAEAHSFRFGTQKECLILLEKVMLNCNKMVVYLDQTRDICNTGVEVGKFEELQKKYFFLRRKVLNLQRSWQKYMNMPKEEKMMRDFNR